MFDASSQRSTRIRGTVLLSSVVCLGFFAACSAKNDTGTGTGFNTGGLPGTGSGGAGAGTGAAGSISATGGDTSIIPGGGGTTGLGGAPATGGAPVVIPPPVDQPVVVDECPGPITPQQQQQLLAGGTAGGGAKVLYPYDGTVLPIGLGAPVIQWAQPGAADAVYVHMKSGMFEYKSCTAANGQLRFPIPGSAWGPAQAQSKGGTDPLTIEVSVLSGGNVIGPVKTTIYFALGKLKGDLFYNTYTSPQANNNGAVMKLKLGENAPQVLLTDTGIAPFGPCWSCHSLAANGGMLVAQHHQYPGGPYKSASFDLRANPQLSPPPLVDQPSASGEMGLGAVYPDGSKVLTMGSPGDSAANFVFPDAPGNVPAMIGPANSLLLDTKTGANLNITGWNVKWAKMPSFSPDGSLIAFNWHEDSNGHSLAIAKFNSATNSVSDVKVVYKNDTLFPGWPFITPDNTEIIFVLGNKPDYVSGYPGRLDIAASDLWTVDIATGKARPLNRANGYMANGAPTYLPNPGRDEHLEFFPTMSPIAAGGYFWVFFTSRRTYGNTVNDATTPLGAADSVTKKIWVSAYNIRTGDIIEDPSNPPFYLPGQEAVAGNIRAFAALEPCRAEGADCETGVDCCKGKCYMGKCGEPPPPPPNEPPPPPACAAVDEACTTSDDCCDTAARCLRSFCAIPVPVR